MKNKIIDKLEVYLTDRYNNSKVEIIGDFIYLHFNNDVATSLSITEYDNKMHISGFRNLESTIYKPVVEFGVDFDIVSIDKLLSDIDSCVNNLRAEESSFYQERVDSLSAFGMTGSDHDRIFGKPNLIGEKNE